MRTRILRSVRWAGTLGILGLGGCGAAIDGLPRQEISGTVTMDAAPLPRGTIQFLPAAAGAPSADSAAAIPEAGATAISVLITDGKFAIERARGLVPGAYKVQVFGTDITAAPADVSPGLEPPQPKETIPKRYNTATKLTAVVKEEGPNTYEFQLTK
ncbi:hypothetical protein SAMN05444166_1767 [Singulisphaera sp. GP187]|uniref:hypothetical protein n=1 Tax=Singulisphaera sp. GP187 TaxID=1882752 RepID=UPI00092B19B7|nr:hypothetical protein [Singulisphaera sp. GP187]SIN95446.1 hypothetical protein SAMN05444166_1767 [Singulisphaera sp. GP187]